MKKKEPPKVKLPLRELSQETIRLVEQNITEIANHEKAKNIDASRTVASFPRIFSWRESRHSDASVGELGQDASQNER